MDAIVWLSPTSERWVLSIDGDQWLISSSLDAVKLCGYLPIQIMEVARLMKVTPRGKVSIINAFDEYCTITFRDLLDNQNVREDVDILIAQVETGVFSWEDGVFEDGWTDMVAIARFENVNEIGLKFYLPSSSILKDKPVNIYINEKIFGSYVIGRGVITELQLKGFPREKTGSLKIESMSSEITTGTDEIRELGVVLAEININDFGWKAGKE